MVSGLRHVRHRARRLCAVLAVVLSIQYIPVPVQAAPFAIGDSLKYFSRELKASVADLVADEEEKKEKEEALRQEQEKNKHFFPEYYLDEYANVMYGSGTIKTNGCSITVLASLATYLTGHQYYPDELARYFGASANNNVERLEYASTALRLPWTSAENYHYVLKALKEGKIVIQLMNSKSIFTNSQHFLLLKGYNEEGLIEVYDPSRTNQQSWRLKDGFENGFTEDEMCWGWDGAWIYDPGAMPEKPYIYKPPERAYVEPRYPEIELTDEETNLLARLVWVEARGESKEGQQAVAEVILNRMVSEDFPNTLRGIVYGEDQFVSKELILSAEPSQAQYEAIERALYGPYVLPIDVVFYARTQLTNNKWGQIGGHIFCYAQK